MGCGLKGFRLRVQEPRVVSLLVYKAISLQGTVACSILGSFFLFTCLRQVFTLGLTLGILTVEFRIGMRGFMALPGGPGAQSCEIDPRLLVRNLRFNPCQFRVLSTGVDCINTCEAPVSNSFSI